jgi:hypothetical protein
MFLRFFDEGLAQRSFLIDCARTRQTAISDPRRTDRRTSIVVRTRREFTQGTKR